MGSDNYAVAMARSSEVSAGLLVYRRGDDGPEYLLAHPGGPYWANKDDGSWTIPKGLVESGHNLLATAQREFLEETGLRLKGSFMSLPPVKQKSGKTVHGFAAEASLDLSAFRSNSFQMAWPPKSGRMRSFPEIDRISYFPYAAAMKKIIAYQQPFLIVLQREIAGEPSVPSRVTQRK
jgi:predicted NUDIX family NTP pyrophosphohydrolase